MQSLTEKELGHALFYALKREDFQHAQYLLRLDASVNTSFFVQQDRILYTPNLLVGKVAQIIKQYGVSHSLAQIVLRILDYFIDKKCDLNCHCNAKNPHYCAMSQALKYIRLESEQDLFTESNLLILKLLYHGATYKNLHSGKEYLWVGLARLGKYLSTCPNEAIELIKMNRHSKACTNRHINCSQLQQIKSQL